MKRGSEPIEKELEGVPPLSFKSNGEPLITWTIEGNLSPTGTQTMSNPFYPTECGDFVASGEHSGEYVFSVRSGGVTTSIYTDEPLRKVGEYTDYKTESIEYRVINKVVFDGTESWEISGAIAYLRDTTIQPQSPLVCSHIANEVNTGMWNGNNWKAQIDISKLGMSTKDEWAEYLAEQYAAKTPVVVYFVLASPTTTSKAAPDIPTTNGSNTLTVGTIVQPSSVYIKYKEGGDEMVTLAKIGGRYNTPLLEIRGLSTDTKPTTEIEGMVVTNGSTYIEIDTGDTYMFDAENGVWHNITG